MSDEMTFSFKIKFKPKGRRDEGGHQLALATAQIGPRAITKHSKIHLQWKDGQVTEATVSDLNRISDISELMEEAGALETPKPFTYAATLCVLESLRHFKPHDKAATLLRHTLEIVQGLGRSPEGTIPSLRMSPPDSRGRVKGSVLVGFDPNQTWILREALRPWPVSE